MAITHPDQATGASENESVGKVLDEVRTWPAEWRFRLVQSVLETLAPQATALEKRKASAEKFIGSLTVGGKTPPSDEEVKQIIEQAHTERYS